MSDTSEYETTFALIDVDGDGLISAAEFQNMMKALGSDLTPEAAAFAIERMDKNGDGLVSLEEMAAYLEKA
jgi:Ca2+-binding EF-hand superfamily protein